jgi:hypothetical protein
MPLYKPDIGQMQDHLTEKTVRNLNDIARIVNGLDDSNISPRAGIKASKIDWTGFNFNQTPIIVVPDEAYRLCVWIISSLKTVTNVCERAACTGVLLTATGDLVIEPLAELLII